MNKNDHSKLTVICFILYFIALILFTGRLFFFTDLRDFLNIGKEVSEHDYSADWILDSGESVDLTDISAGSQGGSFRVSKVLPEKMLETDSIYLSTSNIRFSIYVDDNLIYSYDTRENLTGKGDGVSYHMIGLGVKDEGDTIVIEAQAAFDDGRGGNINELRYGPEEQFRYYMMGKNLIAESLSVLMVLFGLVVIAVFFVICRTSPMFRPLWALGLSAVIYGVWSICDTGMPQLLLGNIYTCREIIYWLPFLAIFPMIYFVNCITKTRRNIYLYLSFVISIGIIGFLLFSRFVLGNDLHTMAGPIYSTYVSGITMLTVLLVDNEVYCRKKKVSSNLKYFYLGAVIFVVTCLIDIFRYIVGKKVAIGRGNWFRFGLVLFFALMAFQLYVWWSSEKVSLERDRFINRLLQYVLDTEDPESKLGKVLEYLCLELDADRAYIFEDNHDGTFDNTYEFCAQGITPEIDNLKGIPFDGVIDAWYGEYEKNGHVLIYDIEKYRDVNENMYNILKPQNIRTLVTGPLMLEGEYIGFFGVDNPPPEMMMEISEIIRLLMYFLSEMISQRDGHRRLIDFSYHDALTGVGNRRAIRKFEKGELDTSRSYGVVMCDINGLKAVNDNSGHDAGDELIKSVASCMQEVFGDENVYRLGGDEFAAYAYKDSRQEFEGLIEKVRSLVREKGFYLAIGYSYADGGDPDYSARKTEADGKMYEEKRSFYSDGNDRRRS